MEILISDIVHMNKDNRMSLDPTPLLPPLVTMSPLHPPQYLPISPFQSQGIPLCEPFYEREEMQRRHLQDLNVLVPHPFEYPIPTPFSLNPSTQIDTDGLVDENTTK